MLIKIKRVYESPDPTDGLRVLVDRLWPRGMTKCEAAIQQLFSWNDENGLATDLRSHIASIDLADTVATVHLELDN